MTRQNLTIRFFDRIPSQLFIAFVVALLLLLSTSAASAQNTNPTDGSTPAGLKPGAPSGSYGLSGLDNINLYNGNLNFRLPLLQIGGRGEAQMSMMLALNTKSWRVRKTYDRITESDKFSPTQYWWGVLPGYGAGVLQGRQMGVELAPSACHPDSFGNPTMWPQKTI